MTIDYSVPEGTQRITASKGTSAVVPAPSDASLRTDNTQLTAPCPRTQSLLRDQWRDSKLTPRMPPALAAQEVVIVGAGLSGLETAARLAASGIQVILYEGNNRLGGRVFTDTIDGKKVERGGELINAWDTSLRSLVSHLGLHTKDVYRDGQKALRIGFLDATGRTDLPELVQSLEPLQTKMRQDILNHNGVEAAQTAAAKHSLDDYARSAGVDDRARQLLLSLFATEYGVPEKEVTAQGLFVEKFHQLDPASPALFGEGYGQYVVTEGSGAVADALAQRVDQIHMDHRLTKVAKTDTGYTLTFACQGETIVRHAPLLVLAIPYTALRHVDFSQAGLSLDRQHCIKHMTYGQAAKTFVESQTSGDTDGNDVFVDRVGGFFLWNQHRDSSKASSHWTVFSHGEVRLNDKELVDHLNQNMPSGFRGVFGRASWDDKLSGGSYSIDNQHLPIQGRQATEVPGQLYFAGEHTQLEPSYMDAAVRSGQEVADLIVTDLLKAEGELDHSFDPANV